MVMLLKRIVKAEKGVIYLGNTEGLKAFEDHYLQAREKEGRLLSDELVKMLPILPDAHLLRKEWLLRASTQGRLCKYLSSKQSQASMLDVGCGNGWFSNKLKSVLPEAKVYALDVNLQELQQASRLFGENRISYLYGDIFQDIFALRSFDIIILNSTIQYFDNFRVLLSRLFDLLSEDGEIHIVDSPFYKTQELKNEASMRSSSYFSGIGVKEMTPHYHHHTFDRIKEYRYSVMYNPKSFQNKLKGVLGNRTNPFPWIRITRS